MPPDRIDPTKIVGWFDGQPVADPAEKPVQDDDPFDAMALRVPFDDPDEGQMEAARCFVEEYITMGYTDFMMLQMFRKPFYLGLNPLHARYGEEFVKEFIAERRQELADTGVYPRRSSRSPESQGV